MVGVPGRSKGCKTCRRRKIKCDMQEPQCGQCRKSSRQCEGFKKEIAFIHRTPQGLLRKGEERSQKPAPWETPVSSGQDQSGVTSIWVVNMPPQPNCASIYLDGMLNTFLRAYLPSSSILKPTQHANKITTPAASWMRVAITLPNRGSLLTVALRALCMTKTAREIGDQVLLRQGMTEHGRGLRMLQHVINDKNKAILDETQAAIRVLATYELHEGTIGSIAGWTSHQEAVDQIVQLRGSSYSEYESELAYALLAETRRSAMMRGLQFFKASFLGEDRWCAEPWGDKPKDYVQQLYDIGLVLPFIFEELREIKDLRKDPRREQIQQRCQRIDSRFHAWHDNLLNIFSVLPYCEQPAELISRSADISPGTFTTSFDFLNLHVADAMAFFWSLRILLHAISRGLSIAQGAVTQDSDAEIMSCACNIAKSVPYFTQLTTGFQGMQWLIFPLKTALSAFRQLGWHNEWQWTKDVLVAMKNRGFRYGEDIVELHWGKRDIQG
ncbi:hypothetical protein N7478_008261 [Penicillium angulare]|uniref:uncharacterized protein n=1 Tax=Penicillium angulare TaxID=116970 RepID=UPI002541FFC7|nr:uncharacterized protein N7478_008261 [Penicillium angulare]KAJ5273136.1 hypothetical protein N7478_008261 [Penicillium angulare]